MKRLLVVAGVVLLVALLGTGAAALHLGAVPEPTYTVAQAAAGLRQHPRRWVNRTVLVRGVSTEEMGVGDAGGRGTLSWDEAALVDPQPDPARCDAHCPLQGPAQPSRSIFLFMRRGRLLLMANVPGTAPSLLLRGARPAAEPSILDRATRWVALAAGRLLGGERRSTTYEPGPPRPRVYRVQLLAPPRCPAPLAPPCYTAIMR